MVSLGHSSRKDSLACSWVGGRQVLSQPGAATHKSSYVCLPTVFYCCDHHLEPLYLSAIPTPIHPLGPAEVFSPLWGLLLLSQNMVALAVIHLVQGKLYKCTDFTVRLLGLYDPGQFNLSVLTFLI